jgi:hypothetical protein
MRWCNNCTMLNIVISTKCHGAIIEPPLVVGIYLCIFVRNKKVLSVTSHTFYIQNYNIQPWHSAIFPGSWSPYNHCPYHCHTSNDALWCLFLCYCTWFVLKWWISVFGVCSAVHMMLVQTLSEMADIYLTMIQHSNIWIYCWVSLVIGHL